MSEIFAHDAFLKAYVRRNWRNRNDHEDIRQEVYARLLASCADMRPRVPRAFLVTAARNLLSDLSRRAKRHETEASIDAGSPVPSESGPENQLCAEENLRFLYQALQCLPPRRREVVYRRRIDGEPQKRIAAEMGISEHTVEHHSSQGSKRLRLEFEALTSREHS